MCAFCFEYDKKVFPSNQKNRTVIYLIRHGQSVGNLSRICLGHTDLGLTELGLKQAECCACALASVEADAVYSSDLCRAMQTAAPSALARGMKVNGISSLRELYFGDWEGKSVDYLSETYKDLYSVGWRENFGTFTAPGGESVLACADRVVQTLRELGERHLGSSILVASHAACIRALWGVISGAEAEDIASLVPFPSNASFSVIIYEDGILTPVSYSNDAHLGELLTALPMK